MKRKYPVILMFLLAFVLSPAGVAKAATGDITAVRISSAPYKDSWVAEIDIEGMASAGTFSMGMGNVNDPAGARILLNVTSPGYDTNGNVTSVTRTVYGTKFLRQPYPNEALADMTTAGNTLTVKVILSEYIYTADTNITANIGAGFYTNGTSNSASSSVAVVNMSTLDYPKVIGRWAWPGYERATGDFLVEATAFHKFGTAGKPLAAMKFIASDQHGNSTSQTVTTMTKSTRTGDANNNVLVYAATIPVSSFTQGDKIMVNFEAYPWIGIASSTLKSATTSDGVAQPSEQLGPLTNVLDKTGAYGVAYVLLDPLGKTGTSTGAAIYTSQAAAEAGGTATAFSNVRNAWTAIRTYNTANFGRTNAGGGVILLNPGTYNFATGTLPISTTMDTWLIVKPASTALASSTILNGAASPNLNFTGLIKLEGVTIVATSTVLRDITGSVSVWLHNSYVNSTGASSAQPFIGNKVFYITQNQFAAIAGGTLWATFSTSKGPAALVRGNSSASVVYTHQYATLGNKNVITGPAGEGFVEIGDSAGNQPSNNSIYAFNSAYNVNNVALYAMGSGMSNVAVVQNVLESQNAVSPLIQIAADSSVGTMNNVIVWNNTAAGQRESFAYNEYATTSEPRYNWSIRNNAFQLSGSKSDTFSVDPNGLRIANWSAVNMVGSSNNVTQTNNAFVFEFLGLSSIFNIGNSSTTPLWVNDRSRLGAGGGNGDYNLVFNTVAVDLATSTIAQYQTLPYDFNGNLIYGTVDAGAYEYIPTLLMGTDQVSTSTTIRLYGDEKFRNESTPTGAGTANLTISIPGTNTTEWLDVNISTWINTGTRQKTWSETSSTTALNNTVHTVGDLAANTPYTVTVDGTLATSTITGCTNGVCTSDGSGKISFTYTGGYSTHTFDVVQGAGDTTVPILSSISVATTTTAAVITWTTSELATSTVSYGLTTGYGTASSSAVSTTSQSITLTGLTPATLYHYLISSADTTGNTATSSDLTFTTAAAPDTTAPVISSVASSTTSTTATITWTTNENASSTVLYGASSGYGTSSTSASMITNHSISLTGLTPSTLYHFQVGGADASNNISTSSDLTFTTTAAPDTTAPVISSIASSTTNTSATIAWNTDENATSKLSFGTSPGTYSVGSSSASLVTSHTLNVATLSSGITYYGVVVSADSANNIATSSEFSFTTTSTPDTTAPVISSVSVGPIGETDVTITWTTDELSDTQVNYGPTTSYGASTTLDTLLTTSHSVTVSGLTAATLYHYRVRSKDSFGNQQVDVDGTFTTASVQVTGGKSHSSSNTGGGSTTVTTVFPQSGTTSDLRREDRGLLVLQLQTQLVARGYMAIQYITGYFGPITETAVMAFQKNSLLASTGVVDTNTRALLFGTTAQTSTTTNVLTGDSSILFTSPLKIGSKSNEVLNLQHALIARGYMAAKYGTGYFGPITETAVGKFQTKYGLAFPNERVYGHVGPITRAKLNMLVQGGLTE